MASHPDGSQRSNAALSSLRPLLPYALAYKGRILAALAALVLASAMTLVMPVAVRRVIDLGFTDGGRGLINAYFGVLILVVGLLALASASRYYFVITLGERVVADLRSAVFRHLTSLDPAFFDQTKSGEIVSRLTADTTQVKAAFGASISIALRNLFLFLGAVALMIVTSPKLSALVLIAIPVIVLPLVVSGRAVRRRSRAAQDRLADASAYAAEAIGAVRTMQAFGMERQTALHFASAAEEAFDAARLSTTMRAFLTGIGLFLVSASVVGVLWYGAQDVMAGTMTAGQLSQFVLYAVFAASSLGQLSEVYGELAQAAGAAERLGEILAAKPAIEAPPAPKALPQPSLGTVAFENVHFAYPTRSEQQALHGLTFRMAPGERVALVGPSGAGKSTVLQLLLRFYDPQQGTILVDGIPIKDTDPLALRRRMALVPQEPTVFAASVFDNIRYGRPEASEEEVRHAAELASADGFIRALPQGYATQIGERGVTLSGGQRQRLAIARAILKDAPILLLDEATSALDAESEKKVQVALDRLMQGRTTLVIAHRLATVRSADRILVMEGGCIVEEGTHDTLLAASGLYARLAHLQFTDEHGRAQAAE
ncbi:ABC transporter transmembrane domain-containing protein [Microvirga rosea]|uniref:ABC transporter transmembrane domain-containing protein n=1 Tax=Microvirga rosea TaxID=2715425 RepID=UPI001D0A04C1|nr:ABC transporter transmembrane domain-containing protein [Microvirga rosea]MCB8822368.1 ATP-binding cassette domain-containing protein [Microvirga rosea]